MQAVTNTDFARIPAVDVRRMLGFLDFGDHRGFAQAIRVEPISSGCVLVATQGHILAVMNSAESACNEPFSMQLTRSTTRYLWRNRNSGRQVVVPSKHAHLEVQGPAGDTRFIQPGPAESSYTYPDWRKVIPKDDELVSGICDAFNPKYMLRALKFLTWDYSSHDSNSVRFYHKNGGTSVLRKRDMTVLVMPMKNQDFSGVGDFWQSNPQLLETA